MTIICRAMLTSLSLACGLSLVGCAYPNAKTLAKSDVAAQQLVEKKLKDAKSLDEAADAMRSLGFVVNPHQSATAAGAGEPFLACTNLVTGATWNSSCTVDVDVGMSPEGKPIVMRLERREKAY